MVEGVSFPLIDFSFSRHALLRGSNPSPAGSRFFSPSLLGPSSVQALLVFSSFWDAFFASSFSF